MEFLKEFKQFASKGNVIDLAVGVIIGSAFGKIVSSLVSDIIMPPIGFVLSGVNFTDLKFVLRGGKNPIFLNYGNFIQSTVDFLIIAMAIFLLVKMINKLKKKAEEKEKKISAPSAEEKLLIEIRDILKNKF